MNARPRSGHAPRVLQVVLSLNPGGTERLVVELVTRLRAEVPMAVCCLDEEGMWGLALRKGDVPVTALGRRAGFRPRLGSAIAQAAATHRANVVHCHHYSPFVYASMARLWSPGLRIVFTEHGRLSDAPPSAKRRAANRVLSLVPRKVVTVSADLKEHLVAEGFRSDNVQVIHNGIDVGAAPDGETRTRVRAALGIPVGACVVGTVARLDPVKDLGSLIETVAGMAADRRPLLLVIGDGSERADLEKRTRELDVGRWVRFLGHREDVRDLLAACDVYANSSISEGISLTILEAMAARLPVVATRAGGTPEIVDSTCGRLVPARHTTALAAAIGELLTSPDLRRELGSAGRIRVEQAFTLERMVREYRNLYFAVA